MKNGLSSRTWVERALTWVGWSGAALGLLLIMLSVLSWVAIYMGVLMIMPSPLFGTSGIVAGLLIVGAAQGLQSLRQIAFYMQYGDRS